ncbi:unnamed protein product [Ambrosiozyma monospora]|uniref:Unnamed protein product n=1 Tax=Ambrosiozyma monospora TaxID=43982 RepID=A0A9W7DIY2_AMBMO|nr:unnamed protein product [Ambrosiozyma monospora]
MNTKEADRIEQWCSVSAITALRVVSNIIPLLTNTETITFTRTLSSTVSTMVLENISAEYEIVLDGFRSLKKLEIKNSVLNKFPSLPESLRKLSIEYFNDLTMSDMDHGITLPTGLCSLTWHGNLRYFTLPKILNIDKLLDLKEVLVEIDPLLPIDLYDKEDLARRLSYHNCYSYIGCPPNLPFHFINTPGFILMIVLQRTFYEFQTHAQLASCNNLFLNYHLS